MYDATLDYRFSRGYSPAWAKPLWIRLRHARVEQESAGTTNVTRDYVKALQGVIPRCASPTPYKVKA